ncbi:MAG: M28 family peptidase [Planctomycetota bacterium]
MTVRSRASLVLLGPMLLVGCASGPSLAELEQAAKDAERAQQGEESFSPVGGAVEPEWYRGPGVIQSTAGPARFVRDVRDGFDRQRMETRLAWLDTQYRAPGNDDFEAALDAIEDELRAAGYGAEGSYLELTYVEADAPIPAWTPLRASLDLIEPGSEAIRLHGFEDRNDRDRVMLPIQAPSASIEAEAAMGLSELEEGMILVTEAPVYQVVDRAKRRGAIGIVSASLGSYNVDPTGRERHLDAIQYRRLRPDQELPICQVSPRTYARIEAAASRGGARLRFEADVRIEPRPSRTLVATVVGVRHPERVVGISSHLHEPGANDNGSGVATMVDSALLLARGIEDGAIERPDLSIAFVIGDEMEQTRVYLARTEREVVAGISADMTGESYAETGAIALLERMPDPGAVAVYPPDQHTPWGAGEVELEELAPSGLAVIARCAMVDVGQVEGGWASADHPWEGGSDHDVYIEQGVPAVLFWHFTDFAYHTSLDRLEMVDVDEMVRTGTAILSTALAVASAKPTDLDRYVRSLDIERRVRVQAAETALDPRIVNAWEEWCFEARAWLRSLCLDIPLEIARPPRAEVSPATGSGG